MLTGLVEAHAERKRQDLREQGTVTALAHHDPEGLQALDPEPDEAGQDLIAEYRERRKERDQNGRQSP